MKNLTAKQFARMLGLRGKGGADYICATVLLKALVRQGVVRKVDTVRVAKKGRPRDVFSVPTKINLKLAS